jgi:hypothetical protein
MMRSLYFMLIAMFVSVPAFADKFCPATTILAWSFAEKLCLVNHELGHVEEAGSTADLQLNFGLIQSDGCTWTRKGLDVDFVAAGLRKSEQMYHNAMFALEGQNFSRREQQLVACMGLWTMMDFPMYSLFGQNAMMTPPGGGSPVQGSDIANMGELLDKPASHFEKQAIACLLINFDNIRDLGRAALGKGYRKQSRRIWAMADGESMMAGVTFYR